MNIGPIEVDFGPETKARIEDFRQLVERGEKIVEKIEQLERDFAQPIFTIRSDVDDARVAELIAALDDAPDRAIVFDAEPDNTFTPPESKL